MKKIIFPALLFFFIKESAAQVKIITTVDTSLYTGIDNPVKIESANIPADEITLEANGCVQRSNAGTIVLQCLQPARGVMLRAIYKNKVVASKVVNINKLTDPVVYAAGERLFSDTVINRKNIAGLQSLIVKSNYPAAGFSVIGFTAEIIHNGKSSGQLVNEGYSISSSIKALMNQTAAGDKILFENIRIKIADGTWKYTPPLQFRVTE